VTDQPVPIIIDCDPGHDDAIALLLAVASPEVDLLGVSTVAGNTTLDKTTLNALRVLEKAGRPDIEVAAGHGKPLERDLVVAEYVHGPSGLDGPVLEEPSGRPSSRHAVEMLADIISHHPEPVTLIPVGPLTNIADLMRSHPETLENIASIVIMGGSLGGGNVTPAAEFNIFVDPEAAARVFSGSLPITMMGLDVTHQALLGPADADRLREVGECGRFVAALLDYFVTRHQGEFAGAPIHDALAVAAVIWPDLVTTENRPVAIDTTNGPSRGRTFVDRDARTVLVGVSVDSGVFAERTIERIALLP